MLKQRNERDIVPVQSASLRKLKWQRNFFAGLSGLLVLISIGIGKTALKARQNAFLQREVKRLDQLNQSKNQLFSIVAHDLRSAVHALQINVSRMKAMLARFLIKDTLTLVENTEQITVSTHSLLNNLLYWSLSQTGQLSFHPQKISVRDLIVQVSYDFLPIAATKSIRLVYSTESDCVCTADLNSVKIILRNLIDNAIKYAPASSSVIIQVTSGERECYITVRDDGTGIDSATINAVMNSKGERMQQDAGARGGTRLGLSLAKSMTEKNGGVLNITSEPGFGTSVTFSLPKEI